MAFSSGTFSLLAAYNPVVTQTTITINWANNTLSDIATGLSSCLLKDGTQTATAAIPFAQGISVGTNWVIDASGNLAVTTNKFVVTASSGNTTIGGTLGVTGATALTGVLTAAAANFSGAVDVAGAFSVATNKFTVAAASGNTAVAGTLGVTGVSTLARIAATAAASSQHTLTASYVDDVAVVVTNTGASNTYGMNVIFSAADPNDNTRWFFHCVGNGTERATIRTNGGLANFSANNVNLSDLKVKPVFELYTNETLDDLENRFLLIDRGRFKYADQTHDDWNYGKSAQSVQAVLPSLTDVWNPVKSLKVGTDEDGEDIFSMQPTPLAEQLLCEYTYDISQIAEAVLARLVKRVRALEAKVG